MTQTVRVPERAAGERLDVFLAKNLNVTRSHVQRLIKSKLISIKDETPKSGYAVSTGEIIFLLDPPLLPATGPPIQLPVVYEGSDLLVIDKPAGLVVHHGFGTYGQATVADFARLKSQDSDQLRPGIVHRLDQDTSGLLVIAKTDKAKSYLQQQFATRSIKKVYTALVVGRLKPADAIIRLPLDRDRSNRVKRAVTTSGRQAETAYHTIANFSGYTLVEARPLTGRTHQIRVHFSSVGHPVVGDTVYGASQRPLGLARHFLHASHLEFTGPSGQTVAVSSKLPRDLVAALKHLEDQV